MVSAAHRWLKSNNEILATVNEAVHVASVLNHAQLRCKRCISNHRYVFGFVDI